MVVFFFFSSYHVSWLLNFFVTTFPSSSPSRSAILWDKSWWELPLKILIFGIFSCSGAWRCVQSRKPFALQQRLPVEQDGGWCVGQIVASWCWIPLLGERLPYLSAIVDLSGLRWRAGSHTHKHMRARCCCSCAMTSRDLPLGSLLARFSHDNTGPDVYRTAVLLTPVSNAPGYLIVGTFYLGAKKKKVACDRLWIMRRTLSPVCQQITPPLKL